MAFNVYGTPIFEKQRKRLIRKYPLLESIINGFIQELKQGSLLGDIIPGTKGARKVRLSNPDSNRGKRSGFRILYYFVADDGEIYLLAIYSKNEEENYTDSQIKKLLKQNGFI